MYQITDGWLESVIHVPSPNTDSRPKNCDTSLLVIHSISLPPGIFGGSFVEDFFSNNLDLTVNPYFQNLQDLKVSSHLSTTAVRSKRDYYSFQIRNLLIDLLFNFL